MKMIHDKYNSKTNDVEELIREFDYSMTLNKDIERGIKDMQEDMDPLKVY